MMMGLYKGDKVKLIDDEHIKINGKVYRRQRKNGDD